MLSYLDYEICYFELSLKPVFYLNEFSRIERMAIDLSCINKCMLPKENESARNGTNQKNKV